MVTGMMKTPDAKCLAIREAAETGGVTTQAIRAAIRRGNLEKGPRVKRKYSQVIEKETDTVTESSFRQWLRNRAPICYYCQEPLTSPRRDKHGHAVCDECVDAMQTGGER